MPHSLKVRLKKLQRDGVLSEKDVNRIILALDYYEKGDVAYIEVNDGEKIYNCYMDKRRQFIYPTCVATEFATHLGWTWKEKE